MSRTVLPRYAATLWGFVVFMPVGLNYAAWLLLIVAMLAGGELRERAARLRTSPLFWPIAAFVAWTFVALAIDPHYAKTGENLGHGLRIAATMAMALMLTRAEAVGALRSFGVAAVFSIVLIALKNSVGLPDLQIWHAVTVMKGNKSINNALLFALLGASAAVFGLAHLNDRRRWHWAGPAFAITALASVLVTLALPSRTSLLALAVAVFAACVHQWRGRLRALAVALVAASAIAAVMVWQAPSVQQKFELGVQEIEQAQAGMVSEGSWVVRFYMYTLTTQMMLEKPVIGWGIGAWTSLWQERAPTLLRDYNMPHNDFLWMGAQAGIPGFAVLLAILLAGIWTGWRRRDLAGRLGFVAMLMLLIATSLNSATRDAQIGLSLPWIAFVFLRLVQEAGSPWADVLPRRAAGALSDDAPTPHPL